MPHRVGEGAARIGKLRAVKLLLNLARPRASAALSHLRSHEAAIDGCVTRGAGLAPHGFRSVGAERNRKQQNEYNAQQVECITSVPGPSEYQLVCKWRVGVTQSGRGLALGGRKTRVRAQGRQARFRLVLNSEWVSNRILRLSFRRNVRTKGCVPT